MVTLFDTIVPRSYRHRRVKSRIAMVTLNDHTMLILVGAFQQNMRTTFIAACFLSDEILILNGSLFVQSPPDTPAAAVAEFAIFEFWRYIRSKLRLIKKEVKKIKFCAISYFVT